MILLAGGTGTLGRRVVPLLVARGFDIRILARHAEVGTPNDDGKVQMVAADIRDRPAVDAAMTGVDTVVSMIQGFGGASALGPQVVDRDGNLALIQAAVATASAACLPGNKVAAAAKAPTAPAPANMARRSTGFLALPISKLLVNAAVRTTSPYAIRSIGVRGCHSGLSLEIISANPRRRPPGRQPLPSPTALPAAPP